MAIAIDGAAHAKMWRRATSQMMRNPTSETSAMRCKHIGCAR